ncbi:MAG: NAD(P)/FAD-dependent oxidoreductase [Eubacteriaceae bacterium]
MKIVIIGASAAGITAAKTLKNIDPRVEVVLISKEDKIHSRCMLHKFLGKDRDVQGVNFVSENFSKEANIDWLKNTKVSSIDTKEKTVKTYDGKEIAFDKLIITSGAHYFIPPVPGMREGKNIYGFRDLADAQAIDNACLSAKEAVVVGAGLVGMDVATALLERGLKVTIVEMMDKVMGLQLDDKSAKAYQTLFERAGAKFLLHEKVVSVELDSDSNAISVHLGSGKTVPTDLIVVAAGVRPSYEFLEGTDIATDRGITVDKYMGTNHSDIFAAGDVTGLAGIWPNAMKQGKIAAENCLGKGTSYDDLYALKNTSNFYGLPTLSLGNINPEPEEKCEVFLREDRNIYQKIVIKNGVIVGIILQGDISNSGFWQFLVKNKVNVSNFTKSLFKLSYADFYEIDPFTGAYEYDV